MIQLDLDLTKMRAELAQQTFEVLNSVFNALEPLQRQVRDLNALEALIHRNGTAPKAVDVEVERPIGRPRGVVERLPQVSGETIQDHLYAYIKGHPGARTAELFNHLKAVGVLPKEKTFTAFQSSLKRNIGLIPGIKTVRSSTGRGTQNQYWVMDKPYKGAKIPPKPPRIPANFNTGITAEIRKFCLATLGRSNERMSPRQIMALAREKRMQFPANDAPTNLLNRILRQLATNGKITRYVEEDGVTYEIAKPEVQETEG